MLAGGLYAAGGDSWMIPTSRLWYRYPSLEDLYSEAGTEYAFDVPVGLSGLLRKNANPSLFIRDRITFKSNFDLLASIVQLKYPYWYLLDLPQSPDFISIKIEKANITVNNRSGAPLSLETISGTNGISKQESVLLPPPLFGVPVRFGSLVLRTGLFSGLDGYSLAPNNALANAIKNKEVLPSSSYKVYLTASGTAGIHEGISWVFDRDIFRGNAKLVVAPRINLYSILAYFQGSAGADFKTDVSGMPHVWGYSWRADYLYPGEGYGFGARLDAGMSLIFERFIISASVLDIIGWKYLNGLSIGSGIDSQAETSFAGNIVDYVPMPLLLAGWQMKRDPVTAIFSLNLRYVESVGVAASVKFILDAVDCELILRYQDSMQYELRSGARFGNLRIEGALIHMREPISNQQLVGLGLRVGVLRAE